MSTAMLRHTRSRTACCRPYNAAGPGAANRTAGPKEHAVNRTVRMPRPPTVKHVEETTAAPHSKYFPDLVVSLLWGAASLVDKRGPSSCACCEGLGRVPCPSCHSQGVTETAQGASANAFSRGANNLRLHLAAKRLAVLNAMQASGEQEWLVTNRCRRCRGQGYLYCPTCHGNGKRTSATNAECELL